MEEMRASPASTSPVSAQTQQERNAAARRAEERAAEQERRRREAVSILTLETFSTEATIILSNKANIPRLVLSFSLKELLFFCD